MRIKVRRRSHGTIFSIGVTLALGAAACGGDPMQETAGPPPATAAPSEETATPSEETDDERVPADDRPEPAAPNGVAGECEASLVELLRAIEPFVDGRSIADVNADDFDVDGLAAATAPIEEQVQAHCPAMDNAEAYALMLDIARAHATGTVWYLEAVADANGARSD